VPWIKRFAETIAFCFIGTASAHSAMTQAVTASTGPADKTPPPLRIKIDEIEAKYLVDSFSFELDDDGAAEIVVNYANPAARVFGSDGNWTPEPVSFTLQSLKYDATARAIVYEAGSRRTVCAIARRRRFWRPKNSFRTVGACRVKGESIDTLFSQGFKSKPVSDIDVYLDVR
jgi:hypothetical protein